MGDVTRNASIAFKKANIREASSKQYGPFIFMTCDMSSADGWLYRQYQVGMVLKNLVFQIAVYRKL